ncbi:SDR family NAD(P)-dependent oxidoreductase [Streptomyces sp. SL13]|uniref:SDR family NAD(P)-dependent oxidoreductase n=1 Tax=Streptantibioticus silvisoli TaxID=2705255 RepID=A0AA90H8X2_9ACTN|nr:SDR family NAD(P)-dependent oxidoreductase [Streptantibioticus silvisoli]MDI5973366.1 SDR family NAD(P)-dependent oxidoreductase [Streptantibioticus silvisoli]
MTRDATRPLAGCAALVTGASSGIGAATALALAAEGAAVALVARRADRLTDLAAHIAGKGGHAFVLPADLTDPDRARSAVEEAASQLGRLDVLVNNAGAVVPGAFEDGAATDWERMLALNVSAVLHTSRAALPHLLAAADGPRGVADLVTVASAAGRVARPNNAVYTATKHAVVGFSEALRKEITQRRVRVGLVEPGMVTTEATTAPGIGLPSSVDPKDWLTAEDVARAIVFMVTQPRHAAVNEILLRPTTQVN